MHYEKSKGALTLQYSEGIAVVVKTATKATHITFEIVSVEPEGGVELVIWGPYPTRIKEVVSETVGVVWNNSFALGIQTLNVKTLGGYPTTENDVMPGRGDTAKPREFGSVLQAFTRDRRQNRVVSNWGHEKYYVPAYYAPNQSPFNALDHTFRHSLITWQDLGPIPTCNPSHSNVSADMSYLVSLIQPSALFLRSRASCV
jgi:hypothetical protein